MTLARSLSPRQVVGVGTLLVRPDGALLLGRRHKRGEPESWCLPGGHVEPGETFEAAAARETREETGIAGLLEPRVFAILVDAGGAALMVTAGVLARAAAGAQARVLEPDVFSEWLWAVPAELPGPLFPASAALVAAWLGRRLPGGWVGYPVSGRSG